MSDNVSGLNYARAIRIVRAARGLTQHDLATLAGYAASYISRLENGTREPTARTMRLLADALGAPIQVLWILAGEELDAADAADHALSVLHCLTRAAA